MSERAIPMQKTVKASEARQHLPQLLNTVYRGGVRVIVERSGIPVAGIVSPGDLEELSRLDQRRAEFAAVVDAMRASFVGVPEDEITAETSKAVAEVRAEMRRERTGHPRTTG